MSPTGLMSATIVPPSGFTPPPGGSGAGGAGGAGGASGGATPPADGGATPSIVPLSLGFGAAGAPPGAGGAAPSPGLGIVGAFIISMVPLNLGAAEPFKLKPHLTQLFALSSFCVPQFGQNTRPYLHCRWFSEGASLHG